MSCSVWSLCISLATTGPPAGICFQLKEYLTKTGCVAILDLFEQVALLRVRVSDAEASCSGARSYGLAG